MGSISGITQILPCLRTQRQEFAKKKVSFNNRVFVKQSKHLRRRKHLKLTHKCLETVHYLIFYVNKFVVCKVCSPSVGARWSFLAGPHFTMVSALLTEVYVTMAHSKNIFFFFPLINIKRVGLSYHKTPLIVLEHFNCGFLLKKSKRSKCFFLGELTSLNLIFSELFA